ncbi:MAG: hypothetical protein L3J58_05505 [Emcibacter sp.]|nr:hypothetical protein [Emcibacter sp.]
MMINKAAIFFIFSGSIILVNSPVQAAPPNTMLECAKIIDDTRRLACFDAAVKNIPGSPDIIQKMMPTKEEKLASFGKTQLRKSPVKAVRVKQKKAEEKDLKEITLKVRKSAYTATKKFVLFMENGQVWKQKDGGKIRLPKGAFEVVIKKGMIGGFNMIVPTKKTIIKVIRLK